MNQYYIYRARTRDNQMVTGRVQATDLDAAKKILQQNSLIPVSVSLPKGFSDYIPFLGRVSLKDKTVFARQLATMIEAGLTLSQSLRLLVRQSRGGRFQSIMTSVLNDIQDGFSFSTSLAKFPEVFDPIFINVIRSGEATGKLEVVLKELATNLEKEVAVNGKIRGALFYPAFILLAMVVVGGVMVYAVIPQLKDIFLSSGKDLPLSTRTLLAFSDFLQTKWWLALIVIAAAIVGIRAFLRTEVGIEFKSRISLKIPVLGTIIQQSSMARFSRTLGILLGSGVPMLEALRLLGETFTNRLYQHSVGKVTLDVERGVPMSVPISNDPLFPLIVGQMVAVGEQTGKMDEIMVKLAEYFETEVDTKVGSIATLIEPFVIVLLGIGVAWLVIAILLPIYQISSSV